MTRNLPPDRRAGSGRRAMAAPGRLGPARRGTGHALLVPRLVTPGSARPLAGLATIAAIIAVTAVALALFRGGFTPTVPITVTSPRGGLVMNPEAKVKMLGVQVGKVASIEPLPGGGAALHLAMDPSQLPLIPANVLVDITSSTVFGAKFVQLLPPARPSAQSLRAGDVLGGEHVTVETNTVFQQLTTLLAKIDPAKLNQTLGAMASGFNDRGEQFGQTLNNLDALLTKLDPSLPALSHDLALSAQVADAYGDAAPDLAKITANTIPMSKTLIDERKNLDAVLLSTIGMADVGNDVLRTNRQPLTDVMHLFVPMTDLLNEYHEALTCGIGGSLALVNQPPAQRPGINLLIGLDLGSDRYRYPGDLPRVAATGGPQCTDLPVLPYGGHSPFVVADVGTNAYRFGNQRLVWNSDLIKQWLFGPLDGPPRNTAQVTQPG